MAVTIWTPALKQKHLGPETLAFIAHELSKPLPKGKKRRVWLAERNGEVIAESSL